MNAVCVLAVNILGLSKAVNSTGAHERFRWRSSEWRLWGRVRRSVPGKLESKDEGPVLAGFCPGGKLADVAVATAGPSGPPAHFSTQPRHRCGSVIDGAHRPHTPSCWFYAALTNLQISFE